MAQLRSLQVKASYAGILIYSLFIVASAISSRPAVAAPTEVCLDVREGSPALSSEAINPDATGETAGLELGCTISGTDLSEGKVRFTCVNLPIIYTNEEGQLTLSNPSDMPDELVRARRLTLFGDPESGEPGEMTGSIPKTLMPGYKQKDENGREVDPRMALTKAEGQLVQGWVVENQAKKQQKLIPGKGELQADGDPNVDYPYYDVRRPGQENQPAGADEDYNLEGNFGEVAPLYDRYGMLTQSISFPTDEPLRLPDADCPADVYNPHRIIPKAGSSWFRKAIWRAKEIVSDILGEKECDIGDIACIADALNPLPEEVTAYGSLDIQSKVSLAGEAWANMAGPSGAFASLLPPQTIFKEEDSEDPSISFEYLGGLGGIFGQFSNAARSVLKIASLGNVGEAVDCLIYGLTAHPANARSQVCNKVLVSGKFIGWPTYHGFIFQGPKASCGNCTHAVVEAIDVGPGPNVNMGDAVLATVVGTITATGTDNIYGNYIDLRSTDPDVPTTIRYGHLSAVYVSPGRTVSPGEVIGAVGDTGMGGIHLHYEFRFGALEMKVPYILEDGGGGIRGCLAPNCPDIQW